MDVYELVDKLGGEVVRGRARVRKGMEYVTIGIIDGDTMQYTDEGTALLNEYLSAPEVKKSAKVPKTAVPEVQEPVVNSEESPADVGIVESNDAVDQ